MRGKSGYFEKRMKGKLYSPDNSWSLSLNLCKLKYIHKY
jgi:hypothetical protein